MSNKPKKNSKATTKQKKGFVLPLIAVVAVVACAAIVAFANGGFRSTADRSAALASANANGAIVDVAGDDLVIPVADITTDASFFPVEVDGTKMEVIAVRASDGTVRTAFNTCQVCYDSGRGYYVQSGNYLVCQNCGNRFSMDQVEIESGGCNPWPIFAKNKTVTDDAITISYDFLQESKEIFSRWKGNY